MKKEMEVILKEMKQKKKEPCIIGKYYYNILKLKPEDILFFENSKKGSKIYVRTECVGEELKDKMTTEKKLEELYYELENYGFEFAHNRYLVNLNYVVQFFPEGDIRLQDDTVLSVSRSCLKKFREALVKNISNKY
jgi:DNA-binding LytR/AlgR family response regulator